MGTEGGTTESAPVASISPIKGLGALLGWSMFLSVWLESRSNLRTEQLEARVRVVEELLTLRTTSTAVNEVQPAPLDAYEAGVELEAEWAQQAEAVREGPTPSLRATARERPRRLTGLYKVGTTGAGLTCYSFSGATSQADMANDYCRFDANTVCRGCFVATEDSNDKVLEVARCSSARYKAGPRVEEQIMVEITVINADADNLLTVKGCSDTSCTPALSSYTIGAGDAGLGYCYTNGTDQLFFPPEAFQHEHTYNFAGKTILDLGLVSTADINGGAIKNTDITIGTGKSLDLTGSALVLDDGSISAGKVSGGTFEAGTYSFAGSSISDVNINGGTVRGTDVTVGSGNTLDVAMGALGLADGQIPASKVSGGQFTPDSYSFAGSTVNEVQLTNVDVHGGSISNTSITSSDVHLAEGNTLDVSAGTLNLAGSQVPASGVGPGLFGAGVYYFTGSTIGYTGIISYADIDGGTIDGVNIGVTTRGYGLFTRLRTDEKLGTSTGIISTSSLTSNTQCGTVFSDLTPRLAAGTIDSITITNTYATAYTPIVATAGPCHGGEPTVLDVAPLAGSFTIRVKNVGASDCTSPYSVHWLVLGPD